MFWLAKDTIEATVELIKELRKLPDRPASTAEEDE